MYTLMESDSDSKKEKLDDQCNAPYRELMGCLTYTTITTRPDWQQQTILVVFKAVTPIRIFNMPREFYAM